MIQWITDFSQRIKQLQQISKVVSTSGAKELQVAHTHVLSLVRGKNLTPQEPIESLNFNGFNQTGSFSLVVR